MKSKYRMGWLFVCFDLPVKEKEDMRKANKFRQSLLKLGYFMLQNSIYVRSCVTYDRTEQFIKVLRQIAPTTGNINVIYITDAQWSNSVNIQNSDYYNTKYKVEIGKNGPKQMTIW